MTEASDLHEFRPDWTIAPAAMLKAWMDQHHSGTEALAVASGAGQEHQAEAGALIREVLERGPLTELHFRVLARGTGVPERFWRNLEQGYRADLSEGRKDVTST